MDKNGRIRIQTLLLRLLHINLICNKPNDKNGLETHRKCRVRPAVKVASIHLDSLMKIIAEEVWCLSDLQTLVQN